MTKNRPGDDDGPEMVALTIRFPAALYAEMTRRASSDDQRLAQIVRKAVRLYLQPRQHPQPAGR